MCDVLIIERPKACHVFCECGFVAMMTSAPGECPDCGGIWEQPRFEEAF